MTLEKLIYNKRPLICKVDADVVVIAISVFRWLSASEIWIAFGSGKAFRYHKIAAVLCPQESVALWQFMPSWGVTMSRPFNKGRKTAWDTWKVYEDRCYSSVCYSK